MDNSDGLEYRATPNYKIKEHENNFLQLITIECFILRKDLKLKQQAEICCRQSEIADNDRQFIKPMADYIMKITKNLH